MKNLQTLYRFELKKILSRKIVWITVAVMMIFTIFTTCGQLMGGLYIDGKKVDTTYNLMLKTRAEERALTGRLIDQQLLEETWDAYGKIPDTGSTHYTGTDEYWEYAFHYSAIFTFVQSYTGMTTTEAFDWKAEEVDEAELYSRRQDMLEQMWNRLYLSEGEKEYWGRQELSIERPLRFAYKEGWWTLFNALYTTGITVLLTVAICLSNIFTVEQVRKTDQLIFCSRYGKDSLYLAKILAGISFSVGVAFLYTVASFIEALAVYGGDGFSAAFQLVFPAYSAQISVGWAVLAGYGLMFIAAILTGAFVMVLSEALKNGTGTLAVANGIILLTVFVDMPYRYRALAQIWEYIPSELLSIWSIFDSRLVPLAGTYLTNIQFVPVLYTAATGIIFVIGFKIYQRYQVEAR